MLYEVLPDPRKLRPSGDSEPVQVLQIHRLLPDQIPVGHFEANCKEVVDELVDRTTYLRLVNEACARLGETLELRFFDHFEDRFDASVLDDLPAVTLLSIDGVPEVTNPEAVGRLPNLKHLRFGPRHIERAGILAALGVDRLLSFTLAGTPTPAVDLAPLGDAASMRSLRLLGHGKNVEAVGNASSLVELALQPSTKFTLDFINRLASLETLKLVVGSTSSIEAIEVLPNLRDLSFRETRGLKELGDLQRFPSLRRLQVSDQPRIEEIRMGPRNAALEHIYLYSVPRLRALDGFSALPKVRSLFTYDSLILLDQLKLPATLTHLQLMTKPMKGRDAHKEAVRSLHLISDVHPDATFFYK
jgi:hypothetical protein